MHDEPTAPNAIMALATAQLSFRTKVGHLILLIVAIAAVVALASLLLTERELPERTFVALSALLNLNLIWAGYASWVLSTRRTLLSNHRVIAGRIAVAASAMFTLGAAFLGLVAGQSAWPQRS